jgi:hypothetical protein
MFILEKLNISKSKYRNLHHPIPSADLDKHPLHGNLETGCSSSSVSLGAGVSDWFYFASTTFTLSKYLVPNDYYLSPRMKVFLKEYIFQLADEVKEATSTVALTGGCRNPA